MKQTLIALAVLVVVALILLFLFTRASAPGLRNTAGDGVAATSSTATSSGAVSGAATGTDAGSVPPAFYYKG
jgi:preprotein translocase subunit SecG